MKISKLQLMVGILVVLVVGVCVFYLVPKSNSSDSATNTTTQKSGIEYMADQYKNIESTAKKHNVVVVTYDTNASYSKTFVKMAKETAKKFPDTKVLYVKNDDGYFIKYYSESENTSVTELGEIPNTNIFILEKGKKIKNIVAPHELDQSKIDNGGYSKTATPGIVPINSNVDIFLSGDTNKDNIYLLKHIDTDPEAKKLIQTGVIDFSFNYLHHDN
ncbi:hypothetical protein K1728_06520 [Weissella confusa]|uniref:hypothetical protein n=1 Tax=Weissella confusa TaxID=1583 RepID=UPI001C6F8921|nr:hypothetical protein [Weissella confusa]QYU56845.1 hypothetical protein K1728_06520 [Weissella confusa]